MLPSKTQTWILPRGRELLCSVCSQRCLSAPPSGMFKDQLLTANTKHEGQVKHSQTALPFSKMLGPKGARRIPYIGTLLMFKPFSPYTIDTFDRMVSSKHDKYGAIFRMRMGKEYTVFTENVADVVTIFRTEGPYPRRRLMNLNKVFRERNNLPLALGGLSGPEWHELRRPLNPLLNKPQMCLHYLSAQNNVADDFVKRLGETTLSREQQCEEFFKYAAESIGVVCFNCRLGFLNSDLSSSRDKHNLLEAFKTVMHCNYVAMVGLERRYQFTEQDEFYQLYSRAMKLIAHESMQYVEAVMSGLKAKQTSGSQTIEQESDLRAYIETNLLASLIVNSNLEMNKIIAIIESLLVVGTDSTAKNLAVLLYNLARHPEKQQKAADEIMGIMGENEPVTPKTISEMHYLKACVKESMRLNFPTANGTMRILNQDTVLSGYLVPKDTNVILGMRRIAHDPRYYPDPESYKPERWLRQKQGSQTRRDEVVSRQAFTYLPFGHGARSCIGRRFAEMEIQVAAAKILQKLQVRVDKSYEGLDPVYTPFITPRVPIPFVFEKRKT
ncbi:cytochrome P450 27C1-like [Aplysia californica]|uniref:Cytochrome P450 27C1-like n=1 Tax=Aplysia californica TaxID=6500 RepID=A0ABM0JLL9_APLCA|nr:cytochrome P450 27C1-like [Aplysia californica]